MSARLIKRFIATSGSDCTPGSSPARSKSPLSPARCSRLQEKEELIELNDRLALYIEKVRSLEHENERLVEQNKLSQECLTKDISNIKNLYENELADVRKTLDDTAKEKSRVVIDLRALQEDLDSKIKRFRETDKKLHESSIELEKLKLQLNNEKSVKESYEKKIKELSANINTMNNEYNENKRLLEKESLTRVDMENRMQTQKEEFIFQTNMYKEQIKVLSGGHLENVDGKQLQLEYESKLRDALHQLRLEYEQVIKTNRENLKNMYQSKMEALRKKSARAQSSSTDTGRELREATTRAHTLQSHMQQLEKQVDQLNTRLRSLQLELDDERASCQALRETHEEEVKELKDRLNEQFEEYQDLMELKVGLDIEIAAYRKLIEAEEVRLHMSPSPVPRGTKRRRTAAAEVEPCTSQQALPEDEFDVSEVCNGAIIILEECLYEGKYIKLKNSSDQELSLGGMQLVRCAGSSSGEEEGAQGVTNGDNIVEHKFSRSSKIAAHGTVTVWATGAEVPTTDARANHVMRAAKWPLSDFMTTTLYDMKGEEMARRVTTRITSKPASGACGDSLNEQSGSKWGGMFSFLEGR